MNYPLNKNIVYCNVIVAVTASGESFYITQDEKLEYTFGKYLLDTSGYLCLSDHNIKHLPKEVGLYNCRIEVEALGPDLEGDYDIKERVIDCKSIWHPTFCNQY